jgi:riboflavin kinase, archaea type
MEIRGVIEQGTGQGAFFTSLDWVIEQFEKAMGFKPFPGTLNVRVSEEDLPKLEAFFAATDFELVPDNPDFCSAGVKCVQVNGIPAAVVIPSEDVRVHGNDVMEIMAGCHIKKALNLNDGDRVTIGEMNPGSDG